MSLERPTNYAPRITILALVLAVLLGLGLNADAIFGPIPEAPEQEATEAAESAPALNSGTDFDMEQHVSAVMLEKVTEKLLNQTSEGLPALADDWSPETLPRDTKASGDYVEDEDEEDYYDELDQLNTVMSAKERQALAKLFAKDEKSDAKEAPPVAQAPAKEDKAPARAKAPSKTLTMRPNAAVITKKKPRPSAATPRRKEASAKTRGAKSAPPAAKEPDKQPEPAAEEPEQAPAAKEPAVDPNATAKQLVAQGRKLLLSGNPSGAEKAYRLALKKSPGSARARYGLAKALYQKNRASEAMAELRRILSSNKSHRSALLMMGSLLQEQGQSSEARSYYRRYLDTQPSGRRADEIRSILGRL